MHVFTRMPESVLPFALGWIERDKLGYSLIYNVVRDLPYLFDVRTGSCAGFKSGDE